MNADNTIKECKLQQVIQQIIRKAPENNLVPGRLVLNYR